MGRPLRIAYSGALHHVMSRGNERRPVVRDDADRMRRLDWLRRALGEQAGRMIAPVLFTISTHRREGAKSQRIGLFFRLASLRLCGFALIPPHPGAE